MKQIHYLVGVLMLMLVSPAFSAGFESFNPETIMHFIEGHSVFVYLSTFFGLGIMLAFTPCVLPMVPILSGIIVGQKSLSTRKAFKLSLAYVIGMAITYALAGMAAGLMGSTIQTLMQRPAVIVSFSLLFVLMASSLFGLFEMRMPAGVQAKLNAFSQKSSKKNYLSIALMGVVSTLIVSPCVTAPLIGVLTYIGQSGQILMGGLILFVMALGMGLPLLLVGAGYGSVLPKTGSWMIIIKQVFGFLMLAVAIWMLSRVISNIAYMRLWAGLLFVAGISLCTFKSSHVTLERIGKILGFIILLASGVMVYETSMPLIRPVAAQSNPEHTPFLQIASLQSIEQHVTQARKDNKAVFIEFYASWCGDCQEMETQVFNQADIAQAMYGLVNLKVDIGDKTAEVDKIKKAFAIYGTPTMLFFDKQGQPLNNLTAVGYVDKTRMLSLLKRVG